MVNKKMLAVNNNTKILVLMIFISAIACNYTAAVRDFSGKNAFFEKKESIFPHTAADNAYQGNQEDGVGGNGGIGGSIDAGGQGGVNGGFGIGGPGGSVGLGGNFGGVTSGGLGGSIGIGPSDGGGLQAGAGVGGQVGGGVGGSVGLGLPYGGGLGGGADP